MRTVKFAMVDMLRCKLQIMFLILFSVISFLMGKDGGIVMSLLYMCFVSVIISTQPFMLEQMAESGFINMLPLRKKERVMGRYVFGACLVLLGIVMAVVVSFISNSLFQADMAYWDAAICCVAGVGLLIVSLQYTCYFGVGKFKSQQLASIIMMIPGFVLFFGGRALMESILMDAAKHKMVVDHIGILSVSVLGIGIVAWFLGIQISYGLVRNRDMS